MWISVARYNRLSDRVERLERQVESLKSDLEQQANLTVYESHPPHMQVASGISSGGTGSGGYTTIRYPVTDVLRSLMRASGMKLKYISSVPARVEVVKDDGPA